MNVETMERRCPRLGSDVTFTYCTACETGKSPCYKVLDCWWERFDVVSHMKAHLSAEDFEALCIHRPPPDKVTSLMDLIQQARERATQD